MKSCAVEQKSLYFLPWDQALLLSGAHSHTLFGDPWFLIVVDVGALPKNDLFAQPVGLPEWNVALRQTEERAEDAALKPRNDGFLLNGYDSQFPTSRAVLTLFYSFNVHAFFFSFATSVILASR